MMDELDKSPGIQLAEAPDRPDVELPDNIASDVLRQLKEGSKEAFREVYLQWRKPVFLLLLKLTGEQADAEDIVHDVFIKLWDNRSKIDPSKNIKTLLYLIARQSAFNHFDRKKPRRRYADGAAGNANVDYENSHDIVVAKEIELLRQITISKMSVQRRKMYTMSVDENLGALQIARQLNVSVDTVYNQISAAKKELRDSIMVLLTS